MTFMCLRKLSMTAILFKDFISISLKTQDASSKVLRNLRWSSGLDNSPRFVQSTVSRGLGLSSIEKKKYASSHSMAINLCGFQAEALGTDGGGGKSSSSSHTETSAERRTEEGHGRVALQREETGEPKSRAHRRPGRTQGDETGGPAAAKVSSHKQWFLLACAPSVVKKREREKEGREGGGRCARR